MISFCVSRMSPPPILSLAMSATVPSHDRARDGTATGGDDQTREPVFHIGAQRNVEHKLGGLWTPGGSIRMPLGSRRPIFQSAATGGRVTPQFAGDCRC